LLAEAFSRIEQQPDADQDALAMALLADLASQTRIEALIASRPDILDELADEALAEHAAGQAELPG
jgi:glutamine synthetase adenylyltransferase